jgi:hypothetical protein
MMLGAAAVVVLCFLSSQTHALITTDAKCLAGYDWVRSAFFNPQDFTESSSDVQLGQTKPLRRRSGACISLFKWKYVVFYLCFVAVRTKVNPQKKYSTWNPYGLDMCTPDLA